MLGGGGGGRPVELQPRSLPTRCLQIVPGFPEASRGYQITLDWEPLVWLRDRAEPGPGPLFGGSEGGGYRGNRGGQQGAPPPLGSPSAWDVGGARALPPDSPSTAFTAASKQGLRSQGPRVPGKGLRGHFQGDHWSRNLPRETPASESGRRGQRLHRRANGLRPPCAGLRQAAPTQLGASPLSSAAPTSPPTPSSWVSRADCPHGGPAGALRPEPGAEAALGRPLRGWGGGGLSRTGPSRAASRGAALSPLGLPCLPQKPPRRTPRGAPPAPAPLPPKCLGGRGRNAPALRPTSA